MRDEDNAQDAPEVASKKRPKIRTRPMPKDLQAKWPRVSSMLITNADGSQILFIA